MKNIFKNFLQLSLILAIILIINHFTALATQYLPVSEETKNIFESSNVPTPPSGDTGQDTMIKLVFGALRYIKIITVVIGILYLSIMGYSLVTSGSEEEETSKAKRGFVYALIGFMLVSMAEDLGKIFDMSTGTILENPQEVIKRVRLFDKQVEIFVTFVKYLIGTYAVLMVVRSGFKLVTAGGSEEEAGKHKKSILYSAGGLVIIYLGDIFINKVFYKVDKNVYSGITGVHPKVDAKEGVEQLIGITNFIVSFIGPIAVLMLIVGAILYATSGGEDERMQRAKRLLFAAAVGIVIIYGAFAIVSTVLAGRLQDLGSLMQ